MQNKNVGIVKEIDKLGRLSIPKEMRKLFGIEHNVEIIVKKEGILLRNPEYVLVAKAKKKAENSLLFVLKNF